MQTLRKTLTSGRCTEFEPETAVERAGSASRFPIPAAPFQTDDVDDIQPVEKIGVEAASQYFSVKVPAGRSNDAHVEVVGLEESQQPFLQTRVELANLIDEQRTAANIDTIDVRAADEERSETVAAHVCAAHREKRTCPACTLFVNASSDRLPPNSGIAADENSGIRLGRAFDLFSDVVNRSRTLGGPAL